MRKMIAAAVAATALVSTAAFAIVTFDPATGTGFVGKGDVQLALGLNNAQIQAASPVFTYAKTEVSEVTWECTNLRNEKVQERARTTTTSVSGVVSATARVRNQITGYNLTGFSSSTSSSVTDGPAINSCPNNASTYELTLPAGEPVVTDSTGGLYVNGVAL